jgi:hypothetical protein
MRAEMQFTVNGFVDEACPTNTSCIDLAVSYVLHVETLYFEG